LKGQEKDIAAQIKNKEQTRQKLNLALQTIIREKSLQRRKNKKRKRRKNLHNNKDYYHNNTDNSGSTVKSSIKSGDPLSGMTVQNQHVNTAHLNQQRRSKHFYKL
jgi:hypothetical protein